MRVSAKADYAVRAMIELAAAHDAGPVKGDRIAEAQDIPLHFLENILGELRQQGMVHSRRGAEGGYWLAREPAEVTVADIIRIVEGPLASVRGERPQQISYSGSAEPLQSVWIALRTNIRAVLEEVSLADLVAAELPPLVAELNEQPDPPDSL
jgi:Rrf2 family protein